ncbi:mandelate racemase [Ferrovibrio sp.]|uniref:mandelate racemase n=1 Tax=Ferrovibrio sp. TaxID=1917215 RepID=UPI0035B1E1CA
MTRNAPRIAVLAVEAFERAFALRMPFRFGGVTNTHGRQAVVRLRIRMADGREGWGYASESLGGKWFDKNPALSDQQGLDQLRLSLKLATEAYLASGPNTPFGFFADHYTGQVAACAQRGLLPLVSSYGPALLDRGILDAILRLEGLSFYAAMRANLAGLRPHAIIPDMSGFDFDAFLAGLQPAPSMDARHTVGLVDPLVAADQAPSDRVNDGLPETLEEVIAAYGHRYFKLKIGGNRVADIERLSRIAAVLDRLDGPYFATIDGNEQYENAEAALDFWRAMEAEPALQRLRESTLFVEQPIMRQTALGTPVESFTAVKPLIIDESDGEIDSFVRAKAMGYSGVSSKVCKGFYKSVINRARCQLWNAEQSAKHYFMSAEDLTVHAGLSLQQDLVLVNLLGLGHVERNGHHFVDGFCERPASEADAFLAAHPDLYRRHGGKVRLRIEGGKLQMASLDCVGFGAVPAPDFSQLEPMIYP